MSEQLDVVIPVREDDRTDGPMLGDERSVLRHYFDQYRDTLLRRCA